jgi:acyl-CoA synthetase (AMP-forming)/AMP-acid ligase II
VASFDPLTPVLNSMAMNMTATDGSVFEFGPGGAYLGYISDPSRPRSQTAAIVLGLGRRVDPAMRATCPRLPVGRAIPGRRVDLVGEDGEVVAEGEVGEVVVTSRYIAQGYWREPELTARSFAVSPSDAQQRCYHTGDLVRRRADGLVEFIGRKDNQIKLRGYRIEPDEVESALKACSGVKDAAVIVRTDRAEVARRATFRSAAPSNPASAPNSGRKDRRNSPSRRSSIGRSRASRIHRPEKGPTSASARLAYRGRPHAPQHPVAADEMVPESGARVQSHQCEQRVGQVSMDILGGIEDRAIGAHAEVHPEQAEVEHAAVPDEGHDAEHRYHEQQRVQRCMNQGGQAPRELPDIRRQRRRRVPTTPHEPCDQQQPEQQADQGVNIDPERLGLFRPRVV